MALRRRARFGVRSLTGAPLPHVRGAHGPVRRWSLRWFGAANVEDAGGAERRHEDEAPQSRDCQKNAPKHTLDYSFWAGYVNPDR